MADSDGQLIHVLRVEIVPDVVVARAVVAGQFSGERRENSSGGELQEASIRDGVDAAAPGVIDLALQAVAETLYGGELQAVVVTVLAGGELRDGAESRIGGLRIGERRETARTHRLIAVHLGQVGLVYSASADVLRLQTRGCAELMFESQAPFHEVGRVECAIGNGGDGDGRETGCGI